MQKQAFFSQGRVLSRCPGFTVIHKCEERLGIVDYQRDSGNFKSGYWDYPQRAWDVWEKARCFFLNQEVVSFRNSSESRVSGVPLPRICK